MVLAAAGAVMVVRAMPCAAHVHREGGACSAIMSRLSERCRHQVGGRQSAADRPARRAEQVPGSLRSSFVNGDDRRVTRARADGHRPRHGAALSNVRQENDAVAVLPGCLRLRHVVLAGGPPSRRRGTLPPGPAASGRPSVPGRGPRRTAPPPRSSKRAREGDPARGGPPTHTCSARRTSGGSAARTGCSDCR